MPAIVLRGYRFDVNMSLQMIDGTRMAAVYVREDWARFEREYGEHGIC